jgi:Low-density lipoprotein receptor domain class A
MFTEAAGQLPSVLAGASDILSTDSPLQRAKLTYGAGAGRGAQPLPTPTHIPPRPQQPGYDPADSVIDGAAPRSVGRQPMGGLFPAPQGNSRPGDIYGGRTGIIPGKGRNLGINPMHRQDHHGYSNTRDVVHGTVVEHSVGHRDHNVMNSEDDALDGFDDGDDDCNLLCTKNEFQCTSACACIRNERRCDGQVDCPGSEDEIDCRPAPARPHCLESADNLRCPTSNLCISREWLCDGDDDCGDFSDETNCGKQNSFKTADIQSLQTI